MRQTLWDWKNENCEVPLLPLHVMFGRGKAKTSTLDLGSIISFVLTSIIRVSHLNSTTSGYSTLVSGSVMYEVLTRQ